MNELKRPLIYVASETALNTVKANADFDQDKSVVFVGEPKMFFTHGKTYYCASQNVDTFITDTNNNISTINSNITTINTNINGIITRLNNIDGNGNDSMETRLHKIEILLSDLDNDTFPDLLDDLYERVAALKNAQDTIITTINNQIDDIDFWYTYPSN